MRLELSAVKGHTNNIDVNDSSTSENELLPSVANNPTVLYVLLHFYHFSENSGTSEHFNSI